MNVLNVAVILAPLLNIHESCHKNLVIVGRSHCQGKANKPRTAELPYGHL
jgi:hypothetical protein